MVTRKGVFLFTSFYFLTVNYVCTFEATTSLHSLDERVKITFPICCRTDEMMGVEGCEKLSQPKEFWPDYTIHWHNATHFDTKPFDKNEVDLSFHQINFTCNPGEEKYPLEPGFHEDEGAYLLMNGSLLHLFESKQVVSTQNYCLANVDLGPDDKTLEIKTTIVLCGAGSDENLGFGYIIYAIGLYISATCLLIVVVLFLYKPENMEGEDGKCIVLFCASFATTFFILGTIQLSGVGETSCKVWGFILQFLATFTCSWMVFYSMETYRSVICYLKSDCPHFVLNNFDEKLLKSMHSFKVKGCITLMCALGVTIISLAASVMPADLLKTNFGRDVAVCFLPTSKNLIAKTIFFHIPIILLILLSILFDLKGKYLLINVRKIRKERLLQIKRRACMLVIIIMTICWAMNLVSSLVDSNIPVWFAIDIINTLQGVIFMTLIFQVIIKIDTGNGWGPKLSFRESIKVPTDCNDENNLEVVQSPETEISLLNGTPRN